MIAANLMRSVLALGYRMELRDGRLIVTPPDGKMSLELRDHIADQRDALKNLLASSDPLPNVQSADDLLLDIDARRFSRDRLRTLIDEWLNRYVETGNAPFVEIAAWFAAALDAQERANASEDSRAA